MNIYVCDNSIYLIFQTRIRLMGEIFDNCYSEIVQGNACFRVLRNNSAAINHTHSFPCVRSCVVKCSFVIELVKRRDGITTHVISNEKIKPDAKFSLSTAVKHSNLFLPELWLMFEGVLINVYCYLKVQDTSAVSDLTAFKQLSNYQPMALRTVRCE